MLNNLSIGKKLAAIAIVPFIFFLLFALTSSAGSGSGEDAGAIRNRVEVASLTANVHDSVAAEALVNQQAAGVSGIDKNTATTETDAAIAAWISGAGDFATTDEGQALLSTLEGFGQHRSSLGDDPAAIFASDMAILDQLTAFQGTVASGAQKDALELRTAADMRSVANTSTELQLLGQWAAKDKTVPAQLPGAISAATTSVEAFEQRSGISIASATTFTTLVNELQGLNAGDRVQIDSTEWANAATERAGEFSNAHRSQLEAANAASVEASNDASGSLIATILLPILSLLLGLGLAYLIAKNLRDSLAELRDEATTVANSDLPRLADALSTGVPVANLASDREPLDMGNSEFGEVAQSLDRVRRSASAVGERVSVLQGGIADTYVNLARRNQSLVDRQLEAIDTLEAEERDSDRLALLYRVDHLATRMRRNAESLLVLADAKAPERHSPAVELREVLRVAIGEVEDYRRIIPISLEELHVAGPKAQDLAHLLAELMENAAQHSPPGTAVDVTGAFDHASGAYAVVILDHGTGVDDTQLVELNDLLQRPPTSTLTISHSIGLQVVSRLAHSLGVQVVLNHATDAGLVATVVIPAQVVADWAQTAQQGTGAIGTAPSTPGPAPQAPAPIVAPGPAPQAPAPIAPAAGAPIPEQPSANGVTSLGAPAPTEPAPFEQAAFEQAVSPPSIDPPPGASASDAATIDMPQFDLPPLDFPAHSDIAPETVIPDHSLSAPPSAAPAAPADFAAPVVSTTSQEFPAFDPVTDGGGNNSPFFEPEPVSALGSAPVFDLAPAADSTPPAVFEPGANVDPFAATASDTHPVPSVDPVPDVPSQPTAVAAEAAMPAPTLPAPTLPAPTLPEPMAQPVAPAPFATPEQQARPTTAAPVSPQAPLAQPAPTMPTPQAPVPQPVPVAETAPATTSGGLTKRTRQATPAIPPVDLNADRTAPSQRTPDQVKNMLSRYKTGLERGRAPVETDGE